jgi:predicted permease
MKKELLNSLLIGILCSTFLLSSKELLGNGLGWLGGSIGFLAAVFLAKTLASKTKGTQVKAILIIIASCGLLLFGSVWLRKNDVADNLALLQGSWQATDDKSTFLMEVKGDSTYLTASSMPHRVGYVLRLSQDSLILRNTDNNILAFQLLSLSDDAIEVGARASKLVFHKRK